MVLAKVILSTPKTIHNFVQKAINTMVYVNCRQNDRFFSCFCGGHHGSAGVVVGNTIQVRLGALTILLLHFGSRGYYVQGTALRWAKSLAAFSTAHPPYLWDCTLWASLMGAKWHFGLRSNDNVRPWGCRIVDCKSRPSHPSRPPPDALSANAIL